MKGEDKKKQKNEKGVELDYLRFQKSSKNKRAMLFEHPKLTTFWDNSLFLL
jgi:hypothetical protein